MKTIRVLSLLTALALVSVGVNGAEAITFGDFKAIVKSNVGTVPGELQGYVNGIVHGLIAANIRLQVSGKQPLFCAPAKLAMGSQIAFSVLDSYSDSHKVPDTMPLYAVVLVALDDSFPCKK